MVQQRLIGGRKGDWRDVIVYDDESAVWFAFPGYASQHHRPQALVEWAAWQARRIVGFRRK
jgi:hypothetical protein